MHTITQDKEKGWTHIDWTLDGVTPNMVDWHWNHLDRTYNLWHPEEHKEYTWLVPPTKERFIGAIQTAPQSRSDGSFKVPKLRYDDIATMKDFCNDLIIYDHAVIVSCISLNDEPLDVNAEPQSYVIHQWQASDNGVVGKTTAMYFRGESREVELYKGALWGEHAAQEMENLAVFMPDMYRLWSVVTDQDYNFNHSLKIEKTDTGFRYVNI